MPLIREWGLHNIWISSQVAVGQRLAIQMSAMVTRSMGRKVGSQESKKVGSQRIKKLAAKGSKKSARSSQEMQKYHAPLLLLLRQMHLSFFFRAFDLWRIFPDRLLI